MFSKREEPQRLAGLRLGRRSLEPKRSLRRKRGLIIAESLVHRQDPTEPKTDTEFGA